MTIFYRVRNVGPNDYALPGLHVSGSTSSAIVPADSAWYDLYLLQGNSARTNALGDIQRNQHLYAGVVSGVLEVAYNLTDAFRAEDGEPEQRVVPLTAEFVRNADREAASGPPILPILDSSPARPISELEDGTTVSTFGAVLNMFWSLPLSGGIGDGWSITLRNDSDVVLQVSSSDTDMVRPGGPRKLVVAEGESITLVYNKFLGGIWVALNDSMATLWSDLNPVRRYYGAVPEVSDLPATSLPGGFALVRATDATAGTYDWSGAAWVKAGELPNSMNELSVILGTEPAVRDHASSHVDSGSDEIDGDRLSMDYTPTNYTPDTSPPEVSSQKELTAHLAGLDEKVGSIQGGRLLQRVSVDGITPDPDTDSVIFTDIPDKSYSFTAISASSTIRVAWVISLKWEKRNKLGYIRLVRDGAQQGVEYRASVYRNNFDYTMSGETCFGAGDTLAHTIKMQWRVMGDDLSCIGTDRQMVIEEWAAP